MQSMTSIYHLTCAGVVHSATDFDNTHNKQNL